MLRQEEIEELSKKVEEGKKAEEKLNEYRNLTERKECLEKAKIKCTDCRKITVEYAHNSNYVINVNMSSFALKQINKIIDNEIEGLQLRLDNL